MDFNLFRTQVNFSVTQLKTLVGNNYSERYLLLDIRLVMINLLE